MTQTSDERAREVILGVVLEMIESEGYDAVRLREVARRARFSLAKIYKLFPTREELIVSAIERWVETNVYAELEMPDPDETLGETLMSILRTAYVPWERAPRMLEAYHRVQTGPAGKRLWSRSVSAVEPVARAAFKDVDPEKVGDLWMVLGHVIYALIGKFADGQIAITDILPSLERTVSLLTGDTVTGRPRDQTSASGCWEPLGTRALDRGDRR